MAKEYIEYCYPEPFYKIKKNMAIPVLGFPINNLIEYQVKKIISENKQLNK